MQHGTNFLQPKNREEKQGGSAKFVVILALIFVLGIGGYIVVGARGAEDTRISDPSAAADFGSSTHRFFRRLKSFFSGGFAGIESEKRDRINVLLLGMGGLGHDGPFLTDTIIMASIKPSTGQVSMLSIPRDTAAPIPGYGWYKINHANHFGEQEKPGKGGELASAVVKDILDEPIDYYMRVDFSAFEELIDEVGGVEIQVERSFVDQRFPDGKDKTKVVSFEKGSEQMDGQRALTFARSRHGTNGEGSDFARAARQQKVLLALKEKVLSLGTIANPVRIKRIMGTLKNHMSTNASVGNIVKFISLAQNIDINAIHTHVLTNAENGMLKNATINGNFLLVPRIGQGNYSAIAELVENMFDQEAAPVPLAPEPTAPPGALHVAVYNGTVSGGLAARWQKWLQEEGFGVPVIGNTIERPFPATEIILLDETAKESAQNLVDLFGTPYSVATSTEKIDVVPEVQALILLGIDATEPY